MTILYWLFYVSVSTLFILLAIRWVQRSIMEASLEITLLGIGILILIVSTDIILLLRWMDWAFTTEMKTSSMAISLLTLSILLYGAFIALLMKLEIMDKMLGCIRFMMSRGK